MKQLHLIRLDSNNSIYITFSGSFRRIEKFESSTYSEVLKAIDLADNNRPVVMKIMRALSKGVMKMIPSMASKGCQSYNDILNELVVVQALSQLHEGILLNGKSLYRTHFFCYVHEMKVVNGNLERVLSQSGSKSKDDSKAQQATDLEAAEKPKEDDSKTMNEFDRMLVEALPQEYVVSVMKHDGQPLWWMMTHKKLSAEQLASTLVQVIVGLAIAEKVYSYEHRDLHVSNILIKKTSRSSIPFVLDNTRYKIITNGIKATIIDATFSRLTHKGKVYFRDLTSTLRAYGSKKEPVKMSIQNRSYRQMVHLTKNNWEEFIPKTNLIWLTYLCETLMKNDTLKNNQKLFDEVHKIRDHTLKVGTTLELLSYFPFEREKEPKTKSTIQGKSIANGTSDKPRNSKNPQINVAKNMDTANRPNQKIKPPKTDAVTQKLPSLTSSLTPSVLSQISDTSSQHNITDQSKAGNKSTMIKLTLKKTQKK